jgi:tripartite-type tricarboxylate transporter receptor subunit TctC
MAGTPGPIVVARLNDLFFQAMRTPAIRERMTRLDLEIQELGAQDFAALVSADYERWGRVVRASGWKPAD